VEHKSGASVPNVGSWGFGGTQALKVYMPHMGLASYVTHDYMLEYSRFFKCLFLLYFELEYITNTWEFHCGNVIHMYSIL
jgi:hypothetical protein